MDSIKKTTVNMTAKDTKDNSAAKLFGLYKAEWLNGQLFDLYTEPTYFDQLKTQRPCVLIGGRGTGKTTVLQGLSYEGQFVLGGKNSQSVSNWPFYGMYYRINTNRVTAFKGPELDEKDWVKCFAHYFNLLICKIIMDFLSWYEIKSSKRIIIEQEILNQITESLSVPECQSLKHLAKALDLEILQFQNRVNNVGEIRPENLSMQGVPIDTLTSSLTNLDEFKGKQFFFLIDEYENLENYQQRIINTIIKHGANHYTFKIGVREFGWRDKATINSNEYLRHPADYERINLREELTEQNFRLFALSVCDYRLSKVKDEKNIVSIEKLLPALSENEELILLGGEKYIEEIKKQISEEKGYEEEIEYFSNLQPLWQYYVGVWSKEETKSCFKVIREIMTDKAKAEHRYSNYAYSTLFSVRSGKRGIRKYYSGWEVFVRLADGNIRFLMELIHQSIILHMQNKNTLDKPISPENQTNAAIKVGQKNLSELEGISVDGAQLTKLLLGLGRIFGVMAQHASGHTPEVNQFRISDDNLNGGSSSDAEYANKILHHAVMHLALVRIQGNKLADAETKKWDYMIHPIFAPFFCFSHRRKRKFVIPSYLIKKLVEAPSIAIRQILERQNRSLIDEDLPDQLSLFQTFFSDASQTPDIN